jgi:hypothetical protein
MTNTISAAANPAMANNLITKAMEERPEPTPEVRITSPSDTVVTLPGGYINSAGEVITEAEVRELNGNDEEAIARSSNIGKAILTILSRGTVRIGNEVATDQLLDHVLSGDRDALLLGILKATFGKDAEIPSYCDGCREYKTVNVDLNEDIKSKVLADPINDRVFTVQGRKNVFTVQLPTGITQKDMINNSDKTSAELNTIMLENCVLKIDNSPVLSKLQVQHLGLTDRKKIIDEINSRLFGPQFDGVKVTCPDCESEVPVPVNIGTLFRL